MAAALDRWKRTGLVMDRDPQTGAVLGPAVEAHRCPGRGFVESVCQEALALELAERGIPFQREVSPHVRYRGHVPAATFRAGFIYFSGLMLEPRALDAIGDVEISQVPNYLKATGHTKALLLNFGAPRPNFKRIVMTAASGATPSAAAEPPNESANGG